MIVLILSELYSEKLINEGVVTKEEVTAVIDKYEKICEEAYKKAGEETQVILEYYFLMIEYYLAFLCCSVKHNTVLTC